MHRRERALESGASGEDAPGGSAAPASKAAAKVPSPLLANRVCVSAGRLLMDSMVCCKGDCCCFGRMHARLAQSVGLALFHQFLYNAQIASSPGTCSMPCPMPGFRGAWRSLYAV